MRAALNRGGEEGSVRFPHGARARGRGAETLTLDNPPLRAVLGLSSTELRQSFVPISRTRPCTSSSLEISESDDRSIARRIFGFCKSESRASSALIAFLPISIDSRNLETRNREICRHRDEQEGSNRWSFVNFRERRNRSSGSRGSLQRSVIMSRVPRVLDAISISRSTLPRRVRRILLRGASQSIIAEILLTDRR